MVAGAVPHYPTPAPIEAYGNGGFRFAGMSHRGSLLCLPSGIWRWDVRTTRDVTGDSLAPVFASASDASLLLMGTGQDIWSMPEELRWRFRDAGLAIDVMTTGAAVRTYNILLGEGRRVAAALIAIG